MIPFDANLVLGLALVTLVLYAAETYMYKLSLSWKGWRANKGWFEPLHTFVDWAGAVFLFGTVATAIFLSFTGNLV